MDCQSEETSNAAFSVQFWNMPNGITVKDKNEHLAEADKSGSLEEICAKSEEPNNLEQGLHGNTQSSVSTTNAEIANNGKSYICEDTNSTIKKYSPIRERCIVGCENFKVLHRVPSRIEEANLWFNLLGRTDLLNVRKPGLYRVCNLHFSEKMRGTSGVRLHYYALPDTNLPKNFVPPPNMKPVIQISPNRTQSVQVKTISQSNQMANTSVQSIQLPRAPLQPTRVVNSPITSAPMIVQTNASLSRNVNATQTIQMLGRPIQPNELMGVQIQLPNILTSPTQQRQLINGQLFNINKNSAANPILLPKIPFQNTGPPATQFSVVSPYIVRPTQHASHTSNVQVPVTQMNTLSPITGKNVPQIINQLSLGNPLNTGTLLQSFQRELVKQLLVNEYKDMKVSGENIIEIPQHLVVKLVLIKRGEKLPEENKSTSRNEDVAAKSKCHNCCNRAPGNGDSILKQILEVPVVQKPQIGHKSIQCRLERNYKQKEEKKEEKKPEPKVLKADKCTSTEEVDEEFEMLMEVEAPEIKDYRYIEDGKCECLICGKQFETSSYAKTHLQMHKEKSRLCCRCGKIFENSIKCYYHERTCLDTEKEDERKSSSYSTNAADRVCEYCGRYSNSFVKHLDHLNSHTGARPHKCSCGAEFRNLPNFYTHRKKFGCKNAPAEIPYGMRMRNRKNEDGTEIKPKKKEKIEGFKRWWSASNPDRYLCKVCGLRSKDYNSFRSHRKKHITERKYVCQVCNNSYKEAISLRSHIKNVHLERCRCKYCGKSCSTYYMPVHLRTHTGERPFSCKLCDQKFISKIALRLHKSNVHNVGNPVPPSTKSSYRCCMCDRIFGSKRAMENHLAKLVHLENEYRWKERVGLTFFTCIYCNGSFEDFGKYGTHMGSVHNAHIFRKMEETLKEFEQAPETFPLNVVSESEIIEENDSAMIEEYIDETEVMKTDQENVPNNNESQEGIVTFEDDKVDIKEEKNGELCMINSEDQVVESEEIVSIGEHMIEFLNFHEVKDFHIEFLDEDNIECDLQK